MRRIRFDSMAPASSVTRSGTDLRRYGACKRQNQLIYSLHLELNLASSRKLKSIYYITYRLDILACTGGVMDAPRRSWRGSFLLSMDHLLSLRVNRVSIERIGEFCKSFQVSTVDPMSLDLFRVLRHPSTRQRSSRTTPTVATSQ